MVIAFLARISPPSPLRTALHAYAIKAYALSLSYLTTYVRIASQGVGLARPHPFRDSKPPRHRVLVACKGIRLTSNMKGTRHARSINLRISM